MAPQKRQLQPRSLFASLSLNRRCKKSPLSLRPRASQRIVISFCPQAASLSLGREPAKCVHKSTKAQKSGKLLLNVLKFCPRPLSQHNTTHLLNVGQPCKMLPAQKATANCVKYAKRANCTKMCSILAEAPRDATRQL